MNDSNDHVPIIIDWTLASDFVGGDRELLCLVLKASLEECPILIDSLKSSVAQSDAKQIERWAHAIGGSLRLLQHSTLNDALLKLEKMGTESDFNRAPEVLETCLQIWSDVHPEVLRFIEQNSD